MLIDPGVYSDTWHALDDLDAVLITHQHPDHVDVAGVHGLVGANPGIRVLVEGQVAPLLAERRLDAEVVTTGTVFDLGDVKAEVVGGAHAVIHARIPRVGNVGYLLSEAAGTRFFHPGDAYDTTPPGVDILAVPLAAPWASAGQTADFVAAVEPGPRLPHPRRRPQRERAGSLPPCRRRPDRPGNDLPPPRSGRHPPSLTGPVEQHVCLGSSIVDGGIRSVHTDTYANHIELA